MPKKTLLDTRAEALAGHLDALGLSVPHDALVALLRDRRDTIAAVGGMQPASAMRYLDDTALRAIAASLAEQLSDELPPGGGDPWAAPERIVFPASQAGRFSWSLGLVVQASLQANDPHRALIAIEALIGLSRMISEMEDGAAVVFGPKEGLAYAARMLDTSASGFSTGELSISHDGAPPAQAIAAEMAREAAALRAMVNGT